MVAAVEGLSWPVAVAAFVASGLMTVAVGLIPILGRAAERIPSSIAAAMLGGVLLPFCLGLFKTAETDPLLVGLIVIVFVIARQRAPLYALPLVLGAGVAITMLRGDIAPLPPGASLGTLVPITPAFDLKSIASVALPLFLVTLVSQNLPGLVVLRGAGYRPNPGSLLVGTGLRTITNTMLARHFGRDVHLEKADARRASHAMLRAGIEIAEVLKARAQGDFNYEPKDKMLVAALQAPAQPAPGAMPLASKSRGPSGQLRQGCRISRDEGRTGGEAIQVPGCPAPIPAHCAAAFRCAHLSLGIRDRTRARRYQCLRRLEVRRQQARPRPAPDVGEGRTSSTVRHARLVWLPVADRSPARLSCAMKSSGFP